MRMWQNESSTKKQEPFVSNPDVKLWESRSRTDEDQLQITVSRPINFIIWEACFMIWSANKFQWSLLTLMYYHKNIKQFTVVGRKIFVSILYDHKKFKNYLTMFFWRVILYMLLFQLSSHSFCVIKFTCSFPYIVLRCNGMLLASRM